MSIGSEKGFPRACAICLDIPQVPKILPCQHIYCVACLDQHIASSTQTSADDDEGDGKLLCPECRRPFSCLPKPETGCDPVGSVHQDFTSDRFLNSAQFYGVISDVKCKVCHSFVHDFLLLHFPFHLEVYHANNAKYTVEGDGPLPPFPILQFAISPFPITQP